MLDEDLQERLGVHRSRHWRNLGVLHHSARAQGRRLVTVTAHRTAYHVARAAAFEFGATDPEGFADGLMRVLWANKSISMTDLLAEMRA
jgi:hypothetical protein